MKNFPIIRSRRLRSTPYTERIEAHGVSGYTVYNHMLLPVSFKSIEDDYNHLKKYVQVWDVAAERQVEISGKDSAELVQLMTCRDLSKSKIGKCYYAPLIDQEGLLVNDPIINKLENDRWWLSIADSDVIFFAKGLAAGHNFDVKIHEPNVNILAIQGPLSDDLMAKLFGDEIRQLKFFNFKYFEFKQNKYFVARSGWSKQGGFEVYVENDIAGQKLYDGLFEHGKELNVRAGCPNLIERIESALLSYGNDFDNGDNPFEANFDKYINLDTDVKFLGKEKLKKIKKDGVSRKLMGVKIEAKTILNTILLGNDRMTCPFTSLSRCWYFPLPPDGEWSFLFLGLPFFLYSNLILDSIVGGRRLRLGLKNGVSSSPLPKLSTRIIWSALSLNACIIQLMRDSGHRIGRGFKPPMFTSIATAIGNLSSDASPSVMFDSAASTKFKPPPDCNSCATEFNSTSAFNCSVVSAFAELTVPFLLNILRVASDQKRPAITRSSCTFPALKERPITSALTTLAKSIGRLLTLATGNAISLASPC